MGHRGYLITYNPVVKSIKVIKQDLEERRVLSKEEQRRFIEVGKEYGHYDEYLFIPNTGLRIGELTSLKWSDVDLDNNVINIKTTAIKIDDDFVDNSPKSKANWDRVPLRIYYSLNNFLKVHGTPNRYPEWSGN